MLNAETIAAMATPPGTGALAVLRISGSDAVGVLQRCTGNSRNPEPRRATLVRVRDAAGRVLDEAVATYFAGPASFTGEDVVELSCHGGMLVSRRVLERVLTCGARPAEPGEFSRRAFENGRMDLTQAEAIMDIISAGSDLALRAAQNQLQGAIRKRVELIAEKLIAVTAHVEAYIDFPEEDITPDSMQQLTAGLDEAADGLRRLQETADEGRILREGIRTAIVGAPNVGKSSLLNMLLGYERAIVSNTAGTTRDTIEETVNVGGLCLRLIDTAGLHHSEDELERAGMERSRRAGAEADLLLVVADAAAPRTELPLEENGSQRLYILNKADLTEHPDWSDSPALRISCRTGQGRELLERAIEQLFLHRQTETDSLAAINLRHRHALQNALEAVLRAREAITEGISPEFVSVDLREALEGVGEITGRIDTEDILDHVFSTFCLGK